jgi:hypothetical protein
MEVISRWHLLETVLSLSNEHRDLYFPRFEKLSIGRFFRIRKAEAMLPVRRVLARIRNGHSFCLIAMKNLTDLA